MNERLNIECVKVIIGDLCRSVCIHVSTYLRMLLNGIEEREGHMVGVEWTSRSGWMDG